MKNKLIVSDLHAPFHHPEAIDFLADVARRMRPADIVVIGDLIDAHGMSRFTKDPDVAGAGAELARAVAALKPLYKLFPRAKAVYGNHEGRIFKRRQEAGLPSRLMRNLGDVLECPKRWQWADRHVIDNVLFIHGDGISGGKAAAASACERVRRSVVFGHLHSHAGVTFSGGVFGDLWGMNCGCLIDAGSPVFGYAKHYMNRPVIGCGVIVDGIPSFWPI